MRMMTDDRRDYWAAFAIGAIVGVGATLLLAPDPPTPMEKIRYQIEPVMKRARKGARKRFKKVRRSMRHR